jgi:hypothetical protein
LTDVQESCPAGAAKVLAAGFGQHVAADGVDINGHLPYGLAGVEEVQDTGLASDCSDFFGGVDQAPLSGDMCDGNQLDGSMLLGETSTQVRYGELSGLVVVDDFNDGTGSCRDLQEGDDVARVLGPGGQDSVTPGEAR